MIVMKFGGTSVENATALRGVAQRIIGNIEHSPLVVLSACSGVTNVLLSVGRLAASGECDKAIGIIEELRRRHESIARELLNEPKAELFETDFLELRRLVQGISILKDLTPRAQDQIAAYGERWSSSLLVAYLQTLHIQAEYVDARSVMITTNEFTKASPLFAVIEQKAGEVFVPLSNQGSVVITQGFIGSTVDGITTTIGRGGSDYSAAVFGAALNVDEIQIWTDVDGILSADPSVVPDALLIKEMTFSEAAELAYFGARVLHPSTILPAIQKNIPVRVLNSRRPEGEGTLITKQSVDGHECVVKSIAYKEGITVIGIQSTRMLMAHGFLAKVFNVFERYKKSIDVVVTSEVGVSLTVDSSQNLEEIVGELSQFSEVEIHENKAVFCVVGERMKATKGIASRIFQSLADAHVNIELISLGGSDINLTFIVDESDIERAVTSLHEEFFKCELQVG